MTKKQQIIEATQKTFDGIKKTSKKGVELWSARELMPLLEYSDWRNFDKVITKAITSCAKTGMTAQKHFVEFNRMVTIGSGAQRQRRDYALTTSANTL